MGTFIGHIGPGVFITTVGLYWIYAAFFRYFLCARAASEDPANARPYKNSFWYPFSPRFPIPFGAFLMLFFVLIHVTAESYAMFFIYHSLKNVQHLTMDTFWVIQAVGILLRWKKKIPPGVEHALFALGFFSTTFQVYRHSTIYKREALEQQVHLDQGMMYFLCAVSALFEMKFRRSLVATLSRLFFFLTLGTWFSCMAFIIWWPMFSEPNSVRTLQICTMMVTWNMAFNVLTMAAIAMFVKARVSLMSKKELSRNLEAHELDDHQIYGSNEGGDTAKYHLLSQCAVG